MTVREAFEKAGYPVPEGAKMIQDFGKIAFMYGEKWRVSDNQEVRSVYQFKTIETVPAMLGWVKDGSRQVNGVIAIDLSNLPAKDCLDALPEVVRKVVEETNEQ